MENDFKFREMLIEDLDGIMEIEILCFARPWKRTHFEIEFEREYSIKEVVLSDGNLLGYAMGWIEVDVFHITNLAVHPSWRRRGLGEKLINHILEKSTGMDWAFLEVRRSNSAAQQLYQKLGFWQAGVQKNYYIEEAEDAILMMRRLHE